MENALITMSDMERAAGYIAKSGLFGVKTIDQAMALMLVAQAEGRNPYEAARDYHIIQNRPSLKADAVLTRFQQAGGSVEWTEYTEKSVTGKFTHPQGGTVSITWNMEMAKRAGLSEKDNWKNYPRALLRARCISEGVRTVFPGVCSGTYTKEEIEDMSPDAIKPEMEVVVPAEIKKAEGQTTVIEPAKLDERQPIGKTPDEGMKQRSLDIIKALGIDGKAAEAIMLAHGGKHTVDADGKKHWAGIKWADVLQELTSMQKAETAGRDDPEIPADLF